MAGCARALGDGADVEHLVAHDRAHVEPVVVDRQQRRRRPRARRAGRARRSPTSCGRPAARDTSGWRRRNAATSSSTRQADGLAEDADRDRAAAQRGELADAVGGVLDGAQAAGGVLGERAAGLGGDDAAAGADEEVGAERLLELADLLGDRGLGDAQRLGGGGEGAELERRAEAADLLQRQKLSFGLHQASQAYLVGAAARIMRRMTRDVVIVGGGIAGLSAAWRLRHRDVLLLEAGDRLGGRMRSDPCGDYWLNYGAHLFPAPGSLVDGMARECGLETVPVTGGMMGLAVGSTLLDARPRRDVSVPAAALGARPDRVRPRRREDPARGRGATTGRAPLRLRGRPHVRRVPRPAAAARCARSSPAPRIARPPSSTSSRPAAGSGCSRSCGAARAR